MIVPGSVNPLLLRSAAATGYQVSRSLRFNSSDSAYCSRTPASAGNRKTWTWAGWVKRGELSSSGVYPLMTSYVDTQNYSVIDFQNDTLRVVTGTTGVGEQGKKTTQVFRDPSSWYHIVIASDNLSTLKIYVNGSEVTVFGTNTTVTADWHFNTTNPQWIGREQYSTTNNYFSGYLADIHFIDGQALTPSSFTEVSATTGQLIPKAYTGSYGTNGFRLSFSDNSGTTSTTLGKDAAGSNNWTPNNFSVAAGAGNDSLVDTPTSYGTDTGAGGEVRGNYCTLSPVAGSGASLSNGNLDFVSSTANWGMTVGTIGVSSGKWYWEVTQSATGEQMHGVALTTLNYAEKAGNPWCGKFTTTWGYYSSNGNKYNDSSTGTAYGASYTSGDVIGIALNLDAGTLTFYKNGVSQGTAFTGLSGTFVPGVSTNGTSCLAVCNFGQRPFAYTAPSGFKALCDTNLPAPVVAKPSTVMDVKLYTGNGSTQSITGLAFNPDLVWIKSRNNAYDHKLTDALRGATKGLISDSTGAETTDTNGLTAFNSDGFSLGTDTNYNGNAATYVAWTWDAGSSTATNTQGSITTSVRANTSAGFSVATWTGTGSGSVSVGHGCGGVPQFFIVKDRSLARNWLVYHVSMGATRGMALNSTNGQSGTDAGFWNNTSPTSTVATIGTYGNESSNYVGYFWTPVSGLSSFGSFSGGSAVFVYTGFLPRWVLLKQSSASSSWIIYDTARDTYNVMGNSLYPDLSSAEFSSPPRIDFVSNGFITRATSGSEPSWTGTVIHAAFAQNPFQYARAR